GLGEGGDEQAAPYVGVREAEFVPKAGTQRLGPRGVEHGEDAANHWNPSLDCSINPNWPGKPLQPTCNATTQGLDSASLPLSSDRAFGHGVFADRPVTDNQTDLPVTLHHELRKFPSVAVQEVNAIVENGGLRQRPVPFLRESPGVDHRALEAF